MNITFDHLEQTINQTFDEINPGDWPYDTTIEDAVLAVIEGLDRGSCRIAEKINGKWVTHPWVKKALLIYFRIQERKMMGSELMRGYDKIPLKFSNYTEQHFEQLDARIVPPATVRYGAFLAAQTVVMPSYINIGAYVDEGTMIDTWATVGSCAQIGKNVHISGGAGIGGVLEPLQANPTIIEDGCFIGARSEIVEGVIVEEGAVIGMGVMLSQSTKIYDRTTGAVSFGRIPKNAVVVPGSLPSHCGQYNLNCAVIVKYADPKTRAKTSINELLRDDPKSSK